MTVLGRYLAGLLGPPSETIGGVLLMLAEAFSHRPKTLRNALRSLVTLEQIASCGVDPGARPETLSPQAFNQIAQVLDRDTSGSNA